MNKERAREILKELSKKEILLFQGKTNEELHQALDIAIDSLEDKHKISERLARYLTGFIYDDLGLPSVEAEIIEQKIINGNFEEVEDFIKSRKDYLADKELENGR